jgi:hypothetical protein
MREINYQALYIGLCIIGLLVILINAALFLGYRKNQGEKGLPLDRMASRIRQPFEQEDQSYGELSRRVNDLQKLRGTPTQDPEQVEPDKSGPKDEPF